MRHTSLAAELDVPQVETTSVTLLVDKEEVGSVGASGMTSRFFENSIAEYDGSRRRGLPVALRRCLANSRMLSSDVSAGFDHLYADRFEKKNAAVMGHGLCFNKYTSSRGKGGSNDADAEYFALIRDIMDEAGVDYQTCELGRIGAGGGGTIAYILAEYGMNVIDSGVAVLSMHALWEATNKADVYEAHKGYKAFISRASLRAAHRPRTAAPVPPGPRFFIARAMHRRSPAAAPPIPGRRAAIAWPPRRRVPLHRPLPRITRMRHPSTPHRTRRPIIRSSSPPPSR